MLLQQSTTFLLLLLSNLNDNTPFNFLETNASASALRVRARITIHGTCRYVSSARAWRFLRYRIFTFHLRRARVRTAKARETRRQKRGEGERVGGGGERRHSLIFVGAGRLAYIHYEGDVLEIELNSRRGGETDLPRRSIRCQLDAISERCPTILRLSSVPTFSIIRLILRPLRVERAGIRPMRIELFDFPPFHANPRRNLRECSYA